MVLLPLLLQEKYEVTKKNTEEQYQHLIAVKDEQLAKFLQDGQKYIQQKKAEIKQGREEIVKLFDVVKRQRQTIEQVDNGYYDGGIKSYYIPKDDKLIYPRREDFSFLYKSLEKSKTIVTKDTKDKVLQSYDLRQSMTKSGLNPFSSLGATPNFETLKQPVNNTTANFGLKNSTKGGNTTVQEHSIPDKRNSSALSNQSYNYSEYKNVKPQDLDRMPLDELKRFAKAMQGELAKCKTSEPLNPCGVREEKLKTLLAEREKWKKQLTLDQKNLEEAQQQLESHKRLIERRQEQFSFGAQNQQRNQGVAPQHTMSQSHQVLISSNHHINRDKALSKNSSIKSGGMILTNSSHHPGGGVGPSGKKLRPPSASHAVIGLHNGLNGGTIV